MASQRMRIGVVGLGAVARKAYLPVLTARLDIAISLCTRDRGVLEGLGNSYRIAKRFRSVADLVADGVDAAFVHVATPAHVGVVSRLLGAGVHTYIDKPLADNAAQCTELVEMARGNHCSLMVGFNRRHAPAYRDLVGRGALVCFQKNRVGLVDSPRRVVFDDFIHVVDTLRFLAPQAELDDVRAVTTDGMLDLVVVRLSGAGVCAIGSMNRNGGYTQEVLDVHGAGFRTVVSDLADVDEYRDGTHVVVRRDDWTPVHAQRGFDAICARFLEAVRAAEVLDAGDALRTHVMCEQIVVAVESNAR